LFEIIQKTIRMIPRGKVATYGAVAKAAGFPGASRQVVWALRAAKLPIPWQRVLGAGGKISLPGQNGLEQRIRLESEGVKFRGSRVDMEQCQFQFPRTRAKKKASTQKPKRNIRNS
jgi:methylated-DNA-protein-cysteine methyltransferase-like protein